MKLNCISSRKNDSEFGIVGGEGHKIHPDIAAELFQKIRAYYFIHISGVYKAFDKLNIPRYKKNTGQRSGRVQK
jgi:hypothetical protein